MAFFSAGDRARFSQQSSPSHSITNLVSHRDSSAFSSHNSLHPYDIPPLSGNSSPVIAPSISDKYSLAPDPTAWGSNLSPEFAENDDDLHNPDPRRDRGSDHTANIFTYRGLTNLGCLIVLCLGLLMLFAGYPLISHFRARPGSTLGGFNLGGINATGQVPTMTGDWGLIDKDTPEDAYTTYSYTNPSKEMQLIFSDEFNVDGRTFYEGDDPYWEASDFHYWSTNNLEWCDPAAITTKNGSLVITLSQKETHGMDYEGGHMTTWNKFCFTGGIIEASVTLPGASNVMGLWPAIWAMGNLGRAGYGASLEGMWPYSYDACDVGTVANQTLNGLPLAATMNGDPANNDALSYLPGQRLSRCTCKGESHPGPMHSDGTYVGRAAPEIDVFEAQVSGPPMLGHVSQSAQWAPFDPEYLWFNTSDTYSITNSSATILNSYHGGATQQTTSAVTITNQACYELSGGCFSIYGFEYKPGFDDGYITWVSDNTVAWTVKAAGLAADTTTEISARPIPQEPMYLIINLGLSENFGTIDFDHLVFPAHLYVDWIRVYQDPDNTNIGCDPPDFPTTAYINEYIEAYSNPNLTTWVDDYKQVVPKNSWLGQC